MITHAMYIHKIKLHSFIYSYVVRYIHPRTGHKGPGRGVDVELYAL